MKLKTGVIIGFATLIAINCSQNTNKHQLKEKLIGTWNLISSETHIKDSVINENLDGKKMIKIITDSHFAFLYHDLKQGKDSTTNTFVSGGGTCSFTDTSYTENLDYCNYREWEGLKVNFKVMLSNDTLTLQGKESKSDIEVNQYIIEKYTKLK